MRNLCNGFGLGLIFYFFLFVSPSGARPGIYHKYHIFIAAVKPFPSAGKSNKEQPLSFGRAAEVRVIIMNIPFFISCFSEIPAGKPNSA